MSWRRNGAARPFVYGHRGVRGPLPENTLAAFARADDEGADGVELDVRLCRSGEVVVFHDPTLTRMTNGFDTREVAAMTLAELTQIDLGGGERIPTLVQVLDWIIPRPLRLNVEIKRDVPNRLALVSSVYRLLRGRFDGRLNGRLIISSFDPLMLMGFVPLSVPLALIFHAGQERWHPWAWAASGPWTAAHPEAVMVHADDVERMHKRGLSVNVWTVNTPEEARRLMALGVDGIISDTPGLLLQNF